MNRMHVFFVGKLRHFEDFETGSDFDEQRFDDEIEAFHAIAENKPQLIVLDYALLKDKTKGFIDLLLKASPVSKIVVISRTLSEEAIIDVLLAGALGYIELRDIKKFGCKMLHAIANGEAWISRKLVAKLLERLRQTDTVNQTASLGKAWVAEDV